MQQVKSIKKNTSPYEINGFAKFLRDFRLYKKHGALVLMFLPVITYFIIFRYVPMYGIQIAFKDFRLGAGITGSEWNGLDNFRFVFAMPTFRRAVSNTIIISLYRLILGFPMPILLALLLNEVRHIRLKRTIQTISYLPHFLTWIVLAGLFMNILHPTTGAVNRILMDVFGMERGIFFLGNAAYFRGTLVVTDIWKGVGWGSILYLAAIAGVDPGLYEAAICDGAKRWHRIWYITLPAMAPTITIMLILNIGGILDGGFDQIFNLYNPAVYSTGDIIDTFAYRYGFEMMRYSFSTAISLFKNGIGFVLVVGTNFIARKISDHGLW
jgi:putative aldouronate transport system permease protein